MTISILLLLLGFALLIMGANWLVTGASSLASKLGMSDMVLGLTVVAFGTSIPELTVNVFNSYNGLNQAVFGNIVGSNIFNLLFILGVAGLIFPLKVTKHTLKFDLPLSILVTAVLWLLVSYPLFGAEVGVLNRGGAFVLLLFFGVFIWKIFRSPDHTAPAAPHRPASRSAGRTTLMIILGLTGLIFGGYVVTQHAVSIAKGFGLSERIIGLTVLAIGTSLPELVTSAVAAYRKNSDIALGNILGSNIFNIAFILAISSLIRPAVFDPALQIDIKVLLGGNFILLFALFSGGKLKLDRWEAALLITFYLLYFFFIVLG